MPVNYPLYHTNALCVEEHLGERFGEELWGFESFERKPNIITDVSYSSQLRGVYTLELDGLGPVDNTPFTD